MKNHLLSLLHACSVTGFILLVTCPAPLHAQVIIKTIAGNGGSGFTGDGGPATLARLNSPVNVAVDRHGNVYVADVANERIRKISPGDTITTFAGSGPVGVSIFAGDGGQATDARLSGPMGVAADMAGNIYISDGNRIRKVNPAGIINTIAGNGAPGYGGDSGPATTAELGPVGLAIDGLGNVYAADEFNNRVRKIDTAGIITTIAGNGTMGFGGDGGPATAAELNKPLDVAVDAAGNIYIADGYNYRVRKVDGAGVITTVAGDSSGGYAGDGGPATDAELFLPRDIVMDAAGNLYIGDTPNGIIRKVDTSGIITTFAGNGVLAYNGDMCADTPVEFDGLYGLAIDTSDNFYVAEVDDFRVRKLCLNHSPAFTGGHSLGLPACIDSETSIDTLLAATDPDAGQSEAWSIIAAPLHGAAIGAYTTVSTGGLLTPTGLSYMPVSGYTGMDSFSVMVKDCVGATDTATIYINIVAPLAASPITGSDTVCTGYTITLADTATGGVWSATNTAATVATGVVTGATAGIDTISYAVTNACGTVAATHIINVKNCPTEVGSITAGEELGVYPNPSDGTFTVTLPADAGGSAQITITNMLGEKIKEIVTATNDPLTIQLDAPAGVYFINAVSSHGIWSNKVTVLR